VGITEGFVPKLTTARREAVVLGPDGLSRFEELSRREAAILYAFDLIERDGEDLRDRPFLECKAALVARLVAIKFRWGRGQILTLPQLASDLVRLQVVVVLAAGGAASQLAAKAATSTIPIVMMGGTDPIKSGLVASLSRPGGNITGVSFIIGAIPIRQ
jgi:hypothetical protein